MQQGFVWLSSGGPIPARWDLRLAGWYLQTAPINLNPGLPRLLDGRPGCRPADWPGTHCSAATIAVGVDCAEERVALLASGFADALPMTAGIGELAVKLLRIAKASQVMPRERRAGPLRLDLFHRDARVGERWLALHPREFALLWRLAERAGERVSREALIADVWRLRHVPETNTLEVHVSRLRSKLAISGLAWLVQTDPRGGYRLCDGDLAAEGWTGPARLRKQAGG